MQNSPQTLYLYRYIRYEYFEYPNSTTVVYHFIMYNGSYFYYFLSFFLKTTDLEKDFETLKTILEVIGSVLAEDEAKQSSKIRHSLKSLRRFTKQLLCEIHTFLLMSGKHGIGDGFVNDIVQSRDWCVFKSLSARYERDVFVLRQIASISSEIYNRYKKIFL